MRRYLMVTMALVLAGWPAPARTFQRPLDLYNPPAEFTHYHNAQHADLFWRCGDDERGDKHVEGYAVTSMRNNMAIINFQVRLFARDAKGNTLAEDWAYGHRRSPSNLEPVPFAISVRAVDKVARYDLHYSFMLPGGDGGASLGNPGVQTARLRLASRAPWFGTVEDVCGARWLRRSAPAQS
jgi:hypothetical protein